MTHLDPCYRFAPHELALAITHELMTRDTVGKDIVLTPFETRVWRLNAELRRLMGNESIVDHRGRRLAPVPDEVATPSPTG